MRSFPVALAAGLLTLASVTSARARCGDLPGDAAAVASARSVIAAACPCDATVTPRQHLACVRQFATLGVSAGILPASCVSTVLSCAKRSTCGRPGLATCCRTSASGRSKCRVTTAARCTASGGCVGAYASCCDACGGAGCVTTTTTTTSTATTSAPTTTSTTTTRPSHCGNGTIEPAFGEQCDGESFCDANCRIPAPTFCCEIDAGDGRVCTTTTGGGMPITPCSIAFGAGATTHAGTTSVVTGPSCAGAPFPFASSTSEGICGTPASFPSTTFCCQKILAPCFDAAFADAASLASWMSGSCSMISAATRGYFASVGTCNTITGQCVPGH
jgi:hypothetical protein